MNKILILLASAFVLLATLNLVTSYTAPNYNNTNLVLPDSLTAVNYSRLDFVLDPSTDSCTYSSGNWTITCSDNCSLTTNTALGSNWFITTGSSGKVDIRANISSTGGKIKSDGCQVNIFNEGGFR